MATSSVSLSRKLGNLNFAGVAYGAEPTGRSQNTSALAGSGADRTRNATKQGTGEDDVDDWKSQATNIRNTVRAGRKNSADSEVEMLGHDAIKWTVDIHQAEETSVASSRSH